MTFVQPVTGPGFASHKVGNIRIEKTELRLHLVGEVLEGAANEPCAFEWAHPPGGVLITYKNPDALLSGQPGTGKVSSGQVGMSWALCGTDASMSEADALPIATALSKNHPEQLWDRPKSVVFDEMADALGVYPKVLVASFLGAWLLLSIGALLLFVRRQHPVDPPTSKATIGLAAWILAGLVACGAYVRVSAAIVRVEDGDEGWGFPNLQGILGHDHDAMVHPPLFRGVQQLFVRAIDWAEGDPLWHVRLLPIALAILTLAFIAFAVHNAGKTAWRTLPFAAFVFSAAISPEAVIARPYGLASLLVAVTIAVLWSRDWAVLPRVRMLAGVIAAALAVWADYVAGLGALFALGFAALSQAGRPRWLLPVLAAAGCTLLLPAAWFAASHGVLPGASDPGIDLRPIHGIGHGSFWHSFGPIASFAVTATDGWELLSIITLIGLAIVGVRSKRFVMVWPLFMTILLGVLDSSLVSMRTRHLLFMPLGTAVALAMCADPLVSWVRREEFMQKAARRFRVSG